MLKLLENHVTTQLKEGVLCFCVFLFLILNLGILFSTFDKKCYKWFFGKKTISGVFFFFSKKWDLKSKIKGQKMKKSLPEFCLNIIFMQFQVFFFNSKLSFLPKNWFFHCLRQTNCISNEMWYHKWILLISIPMYTFTTSVVVLKVMALCIFQNFWVDTNLNFNWAVTFIVTSLVERCINLVNHVSNMYQSCICIKLYPWLKWHPNHAIWVNFDTLNSDFSFSVRFHTLNKEYCVVSPVILYPKQRSLFHTLNKGRSIGKDIVYLACQFCYPFFWFFMFLIP